MKPRAGVRSSRSPRSAASRLDVRTTTGPSAALRESLGDREPVRVRQHDVQQHELGPQGLDGGERRASVRGLADDREAASLEQPAGETAEAGVVVHDQHRLRHVRIVSCRCGTDIGEIPKRSARTGDLIDALGSDRTYVGRHERPASSESVPSRQSPGPRLNCVAWTLEPGTEQRPRRGHTCRRRQRLSGHGGRLLDLIGVFLTVGALTRRRSHARRRCGERVGSCRSAVPRPHGRARGERNRSGGDHEGPGDTLGRRGAGAQATPYAGDLRCDWKGERGLDLVRALRPRPVSGDARRRDPGRARLRALDRLDRGGERWASCCRATCSSSSSSWPSSSCSPGSPSFWSRRSPSASRCGAASRPR